ncbi:MAG TPA: hypothetical protein DCE41_30915 [Cytophagales bacterium]|nr:hypothetical protein [Cytophagales bacterium]HAA20497.1 hypothetical protein [Cytophagales bacterium]HAP59056.1 hypothetical protein [Cytophagales bacterium]
MGISIRILEVGDVALFRELRLKSLREAPFAFSSSFDDEKDKSREAFLDELQVLGNPPEWFVLGAFQEADQLIGFVKFRRDLRSKARHKSMVHAMYTDPTYRGQGVGKRLMDDLLQRVRHLNGLEQIHLWVLHADTSAADFYRKCGFVSQGPVVKKDLKIEGRYVDAEYMVMHLGSELT